MGRQWKNSTAIIQLEFYLAFDSFIAVLFRFPSLTLVWVWKTSAWNVLEGVKECPVATNRFFICLSGNLIAFIVWCWNYAVVGWWCDSTKKRNATEKKVDYRFRTPRLFCDTVLFFPHFIRRKRKAKIGHHSKEMVRWCAIHKPMADAENWHSANEKEKRKIKCLIEFRE